MEKGQTFVDMFENYSYVRGASRVGGFEDDTISTISSFHPLAISTSTKSGKEVGSETYCQPNRFRLSLSSLITSDDDQENRGETSSLGLLHSDQFKSESSVLKLQGNENEDPSFAWDLSGLQQEGVPNFSGEFDVKGIQNNLDFIEKEEAQNKAAHPFIQEEVIGDTANGHYDTSSWSVSRALDTADDRPTGVLHTSNQSNVSVSSFFKRRSASLGQFNGSALPSEERPSFGLTVVERKLIHHQASPVADSVSLGQHISDDKLPLVAPSSFNSVLNAAHEDRVGNKALSDSVLTVQKPDPSNHRRSSHHRHRKHSDEMEKPRLATKPPRAPMKAQVSSPIVDSIVRNDTSNVVEKSAFNATDSSSSFLSLSTIQALLNDVSASGSASMLAKEIISKSEIAKRPSKKNERKEEKQSATNATSTKKPHPVSVTSQENKENLQAAVTSDIPPKASEVNQQSNDLKSKSVNVEAQLQSAKADVQQKPTSPEPSPAIPEKPSEPISSNVQSKPTVDQLVAEMKEKRDDSALIDRRPTFEEKPKADNPPADSIVVEMRVGGVLYKGVLYAQPSEPDSGRSTC